MELYYEISSQKLESPRIIEHQGVENVFYFYLLH